MPGNKRPRKRYRPPVTKEQHDPVSIATQNAARLTPAAVDGTIAPLQAAFAALRQGIASEDDWSVCAGAVELGLAIEEQGVVRGLEQHLRGAEEALRDIKARATAAGTWSAPTLHGHEIAWLDDLTWLHRRQLEQLSYREWREAHTRALRKVLGEGGQAIDSRDVKITGYTPR